MHHDALPSCGDPGLLEQQSHLSGLLRSHDRYHLAGSTRARGAAGSMHVCLVLDGRIRVHHQRHIINVNPAGRDIGCDQCRCFTAGERCEVSLTCVLRQIAMQVNRTYSSRIQLLRQLLGPVLGTRENNYPAGSRHLGDLHETITFFNNQNTVLK